MNSTTTINPMVDKPNNVSDSIPITVIIKTDKLSLIHI